MTGSVKVGSFLVGGHRVADQHFFLGRLVVGDALERDVRNDAADFLALPVLLAEVDEAAGRATAVTANITLAPTADYILNKALDFIGGHLENTIGIGLILSFIPLAIGLPAAYIRSH